MIVCYDRSFACWTWQQIHFFLGYRNGLVVFWNRNYIGFRWKNKSLGIVDSFLQALVTEKILRASLYLLFLNCLLNYFLFIFCCLLLSIIEEVIIILNSFFYKMVCTMRVVEDITSISCFNSWKMSTPSFKNSWFYRTSISET